MSKKIFNWVAICILPLLMGLTPVDTHSVQVPSVVQQAAAEGLQRFLTTNPPEELAHIGFGLPEERQQAALGAPYQQFVLSKAAVQAFRPGASVSGLWVSTNTWLFPVMVGAEPRALLTVSKNQAAWTATDIGGNWLPGALQAAQAQRSEVLAQSGAAVAGPAQVVCQPDLELIFVYVYAEGGEYLIPLPAAGPQVSALSTTAPVPAAEVLRALQERLGK